MKNKFCRGTVCTIDYWALVAMASVVWGGWLVLTRRKQAYFPIDNFWDAEMVNRAMKTFLNKKRPCLRKR